MNFTRSFQAFIFSATLVGASVALANPTPTPLPAPAAAPTVIPAMPELAAKSYVLMDAATGQILVEHNGDERLPPASLTKLMTAYVATKGIKEGRIGEQDLVTISEKAWRMEGSRMFIKVNSQVSVSDLLHGVIIQSGNDASVAIAEYMAGSEEAFADVMNSTAQKLGLANTHFENATGLPSPTHYSSANDMAKLARAIIFEDAAHYDIYKQKEFTWNNIKQPNRNLLLWRDKTVDGLKTGHTAEAGYCLVASAVREDMRLIASVFGTSSEAARAAETQKLLTYGFRFYESKTFYQAGAELDKARVWKGQTEHIKVGLANNLALTLPRGQSKNLEAQMLLNEQLIAPISAGDIVGKVEVRLGDQVIKTTDLIALEAVEEAGFFGRLWDSIKLFFVGLFS
ncbi:serine hydrolase [Pseudomonas sp. F1_0610]|uniref:D-alanyl-D-alanine carboxypeptidase family protein n=1 Tax=Pseudomonas sp. F1_0610 TaxID=3114284 RepID=UPI0039C0599A